MAKQNVVKNLENKIQAKDVIVPTGTKQGKTLENCLNDIDVYSTNEIKTNKVWVDGKPIYRKVIIDTSTNDKVYSNVVPETIIKMECIARASGGQWRNIPWLLTENNSLNASWVSAFYYQESDNSFAFQWGNNFKANAVSKRIIIMEYTK